ncbi:MAG: hypothetical protein K6E49_04945 [Lachnospiraceae bacterium]|nr:hypothetical protein [Lachnospiraceae bacterium]
MKEIDGQWILNGIDWEEEGCLHNSQELADYIEEVGFLPLFQCDIPDMSVEEHTDPYCWWGGDPDADPWMWRVIIASKGSIAYGKFFGKRAGFISKKWIPYFANIRRDGYDFDALWDDEKASLRQKKIMDLFDDDTRLFSFEIREKAGFKKGGEKNFEGTITDLQMKMYLCMRDFQRRRNKKGKEYGWDVTIYAKPEQLYGYEYVTKAYKESPEESYEKIARHLKKHFPEASERDIKKIILP